MKLEIKIFVKFCNEEVENCPVPMHGPLVAIGRDSVLGIVLGVGGVAGGSRRILARTLELRPVGIRPGEGGGRSRRGQGCHGTQLCFHHPKLGAKIHSSLCLGLLPLPRLEVLLLERDWPRLVVDLLVEAAGIADNLP